MRTQTDLIQDSSNIFAIAHQLAARSARVFWASLRGETMHTRLLIATSFVFAALSITGCQLPFAAVGLPVNENLPPAQRILEPGPGVAGPGPGVLAPPFHPGGAQPGPAPTVQVLFAKPEGMEVRWDVGGVGQYDSTPLIVPGRHNFPQGGIYRLKISNIEGRGREGVELYPSLEIGPTTPRTVAYLAHNAIPIQLTEEDFDQVLAGNFVTKVIYLPDPEFQELALAGVETLVSTRLDPGVDPIVEADRRGAILAIIRLGNKDYELPGEDAGAALGAAAGLMPGAGMNPAYGAGAGVLPNYVAGMTAPPWGMPITGTPIGLPGPPHIPHGTPAGLQRHIINNHTHQYIPEPSTSLKIHAKQSPGLSYPPPADKVYIEERTTGPLNANRQPPSNITQGDPSGMRRFNHHNRGGYNRAQGSGRVSK